MEQKELKKALKSYSKNQLVDCVIELQVNLIKVGMMVENMTEKLKDFLSEEDIARYDEAVRQGLQNENERMS